MAWQVYLREGSVYIPTTANAGYFLAIEPVAVIPANDRLKIVEAIKATYSKGNPKHRQYLRDQFPPPVVLKPAGVKTWNAFVKTAHRWSIRLRDNVFEISPQKKDSKGGWIDAPAKVEKLPPSTSIDEVAERVTDHIMQIAEQEKG